MVSQECIWALLVGDWVYTYTRQKILSVSKSTPESGVIGEHQSPLDNRRQHKAGGQTRERYIPDVIGNRVAVKDGLCERISHHHNHLWRDW